MGFPPLFEIVRQARQLRRLNLASHGSKKKRPADEASSMKRVLLGTLAAVAAAAALSAFAAAAVAQTDQQPTHAELQQRWADAAINGQLKSMKASLRLTADQEELWAPFESAVKDGETARLLALQKEQSSDLSPMDRLTAKADRLTQSRANLEKIVEAAKPLYASLGEEQKHKFVTLGRLLVPERGSFVKAMRRLR
jgi:hypothetical protein